MSNMVISILSDDVMKTKRHCIPKIKHLYKTNLMKRKQTMNENVGIFLIFAFTVCTNICEYYLKLEMWSRQKKK